MDKRRTLTLARAVLAVGALFSFAAPMRALGQVTYPAWYTANGIYGPFKPHLFERGNWAYTTPIPKFVDSLAGIGAGNASTADVNAYIPLATKVADPRFPNDDVYHIGLKDYYQKMSTNLPATKLRGYYDKNSPGAGPHYLGPLILARRNRPVRVVFSNELAPDFANGHLFLPNDTTYMGTNTGSLSNVAGHETEFYPEQRAGLHLHGGNTPWISDGTPHQWLTPPGTLRNDADPTKIDTAPSAYREGVALQSTPDMGTSADGSFSIYWTNQQSSRLMFYHDHAYGLTRLNVYAGEAAGYLLVDDEDDRLIARGALPGQGLGIYTYGIPLVIQDKTFVPKDVAQHTPDTGTVEKFLEPDTDPTWDSAKWGGEGSLWYPHVYPPNQFPDAPDFSGANAFGRFDYGPWFWPAQNPNVLKGPIPDVAGVPEGFMDTPIVNGVAYPFLPVTQRRYRFRVLNACNDRMMDIGLYYDASGGPSASGATATPTLEAGLITDLTLTSGGSGYVTVPGVFITDATGSGAQAHCTTNAAGVVTSIVVDNPGSGYTAPTITIGGTVGQTEIATVPAVYNFRYPANWPTDGRNGGVPDPKNVGPTMIQVGTEGGFLPAPAVIANQPTGYNYNRRDIVVLNISTHALLIGPAERADIVIDFSNCPIGSNVIMYNDAPAPVPASDDRNDHYTGCPDMRDSGGANTTMVGFGPNTRTIMQFRVAGPASPADFLNDKNGNPVTPNYANTLAALQDTATGIPASFAASQDMPVVGQAAYGQANGGPYPTTYPNAYSGIRDNYLKYKDPITNTLTTRYMEPKTIHELFTTDYGKMNALLGLELPFTNWNIQTTIPMGFVDPQTEIIPDGETQIWKITHNGVDSHPIHFHLINVQVINRVGWDGAVRPPDPNELGWKETVRMNPLEDCIVAARYNKMVQMPFGIPNSVRTLDPTSPQDSMIGVTDPTTGNAIQIANVMTNFAWEYVWHCHILGHEENDMMRPLSLVVPTTTLPAAPTSLGGTSPDPWHVNLSWTDNSTNEWAFRIERYDSVNAVWALLGTVAPNVTSYIDAQVTPGTTYQYRVFAVNVAGLSTASNTATVTTKSVRPYSTATLSPVANANGWNNTSPVTVTISVQDFAGLGLTSINCIIDGVTQTPDTSGALTASWPVAGDGVHTVVFWAEGVGGSPNVEPQNTMQVKIQTTPPTSTATTNPGAPNAAGWFRANVTVDITATPNVESITTQLDAAAAVVHAGTSTAVSVTTNGVHTLRYFATDLAGNVEATQILTIRLDKVAPGPTQATVTTNATNTVVALQSTDATSGVATISYRVDGGAYSTYVAPGITINDKLAHTLNYFATDVAGNNEIVRTTAITDRRTATVLTVPNVTGAVGQTVSLTATLTAGGTAVPGKSVAITVGGTAIGTATTDASGIATVSYKIPDTMLPGTTATIGASFTADTLYRSTTGSGTLTSTKANVLIVVANKTATVGGTVVLTAVLSRTSDSTALVGRLVTFTVNGKAAGTATTKAGGIASLSFRTYNQAGTFTISVSFAGDTLNNAGSGTGSLVTSGGGTPGNGLAGPGGSVPGLPKK